MNASAARRADATGRSGKILQLGRAKRWKLTEAFVPEPRSLLESPAYAALSYPALKILTALKLEHIRHAGTANGLLMAPHAQLRALGISARNVRPALDLLQALGLIRRTSPRLLQGGRPNAATFALTWLPTADGEPPTEDFKQWTEADVREIRRRLSERSA